MAHPPPFPNRGNDPDDASSRSDGRPATGPPRWVSVLLIVVAIAFVLLMVFSHLAGVVGPGAH